MRKMKDSGIEWIGEIPEDWDAIRLGALATFIVPMRDKPTSFDGDIPWIRIEDFDGMYISKSKSDQNVSIELIEQMNMKIYPVGTVLCSCSCNLGQCAITTTPMCSNQTFIGVVPSNNLHNRFLYYVLSASEKTLNNMSQGAIQSYLSQNDFSKFKIAMSDVSTQIKVADYLDKKCAEIDALVAAKERTNVLLKERRQSIVYEAVTKGLDPDAPMKDSGIEWIGMIPEHWSVKRIKHLGAFRNGLTYSPDNVTGSENGTLVLRSSNIQKGSIVLEDNVYVDMDVPEVLQVSAGDILICSRNGSKELIGKNAIIPENLKASFGAFMMIFRCDDSKYLYYILNSNVFSYYLGTFLTSTVNQLTAENFGNMKVVYCDSAEEREKVVAYLDEKCSELDSAIIANEATIQKLKEYRQSIIYEAVTGKVEV